MPRSERTGRSISIPNGLVNTCANRRAKLGRSFAFSLSPFLFAAMFSQPVTWNASRARYEATGGTRRDVVVRGSSGKIREEERRGERMAGYFSVSPAGTSFARIYRRVRSKLARLRYPRVYTYTCPAAIPRLSNAYVHLKKFAFTIPYIYRVWWFLKLYEDGRKKKEKERKRRNRQVRSPYTGQGTLLFFDDPECGVR